MINKDIIDNVEERIMLLDQDLNIVFKNRPILNTLDLREEDTIGLQDNVVENTILHNGRIGLLNLLSEYNILPRKEAP